MYKIVKAEKLAANIFLMEVKAPRVAKHCLPGQFVIVKMDEEGERIPLTICDYSREKGTITIVFQPIGESTMRMAELKEGDAFMDFVGPLGKASELEGYKRVCVIGGGAGCAIAYPQAKALHNMGAYVDIIAGFRTEDLIILKKDMQKVCSRLTVMTDDGSNGNKGFVTDTLRRSLEIGDTYDLVIAIGPIPMMKAVSELTKEYGIKTIVSMNPIMIDGTGMCGGCRLTVGGKTKFACVDGPDFDGHEVDFDEAMKRLGTYKDLEQRAVREPDCRLMRGAENV